ncbi:hypothetical protein Rhopal_001533-T1 [Rhodotorula paludigena]|uniref:WD40 repeat-like protein n=1 Tax=Rhodotorula paludigena TaxID=86838 RepID=A0AAV5GHM0_9BASI|nr:hypothetical protein Rhopal_001533-T1 [Rhodotorula paludigena]
MADLNLPPQSFFAAPEGVYTLVSTLIPAASSTQGSSTAHFTPSAAAATPAPGGQNVVAALEQANAPPAYPSRLAVVAVQLPKAGAGLSGLGMSIGRGRGKDAEAGPTTPGLSAGDAVNPLDSLAGSGNGGAAGTTNGQAPSSPVPKRKPLTSSFSMLGGLSLASGEGAAVATSRPARAFKGSSSSFIRSWEGLPLSQVQLKAIAESNAGRDTIFGFQTLGKAIVWSEIGQGKKDALARVIFSSFPTCIDANQHTASGSQIDVLIGFNSGDIIWMDPLTARYSRFNKSGCITSSAITSILWLPPAPPTSASSPGTDPNYSPPGNRSNLFVTSHADGSIVLWDKDKEDWNGFVTQPFPSVASAYTPGLDSASSPGKENEWPLAGAGAANMGSFKVAAGQEDMVVSKPPATDRKGQTATKNNPVAHWRLSRKAITAFAFSPDLTLCAAVGEDGCLRIIDVLEEQLLDVFSSYFGAINSVAWSPDGRFVVTGGQDDLCTVYAPLEQHIVAHCQGHCSWVTGVAWDAWRTEDRTLRFASVGEDCKLILWDLSSASLTRPKAHAHPHIRRHSSSSQTSLHRRSHSESGQYLPLGDGDDRPPSGPAFHPAPRRDDVSILQPIMVKTLSNDLLYGLHVLQDYIVLATRNGTVLQFDRPPDSDVSGLSSEFAASVVRLDARART